MYKNKTKTTIKMSLNFENYYNELFASVKAEFGKMTNAQLYKYICENVRGPRSRPIWKNSKKERMLEWIVMEKFITKEIPKTCETCEVCDETVKLYEKSNSYWCEGCAEQVPCKDCGCWYFETEDGLCDNCIEREIDGICYECGIEGKFIGKEGDDWCCVDCSSI